MKALSPPPLVKRLAKSTPNLELQVVSSNHIDAVWQLEEGQADLVIGSFNKLPESVRRKTLLREDEVIVVRARHPLTRGKVTKFLQMSDMVAITPRRLALWAAANAPLFLLDPPYPAVAVEIEMVWDQTSDEDHTIRWLLNELVASVGDLQ